MTTEADIYIFTKSILDSKALWNANGTSCHAGISLGLLENALKARHLSAAHGAVPELLECSFNP